MSGIGDPSSRYNVLSNWGRLAGKLTEGDYSRILSSNFNLLLSAIKKARFNNKNKGAEGKEI